MYKSLKGFAGNAVELKRRLATDSYGDKQLSPSISIYCMIVGKIETIKNLKGEETVSSQRLYCYQEESFSIKSGDEITVNEETYTVKHVEGIYDKGIQVLNIIYL